VWCYLHAGHDGTGASLGYGTSPMVAAADGTYHGTLSVSVHAKTKPGSYQCDLMVFHNKQEINIVNTVPLLRTRGWTGNMQTTVNLP